MKAFLFVLFIFVSPDSGLSDVGYIIYGPFNNMDECVVASSDTQLVLKNIQLHTGIPVEDISNYNTSCATEDEMMGNE